MNISEIMQRKVYGKTAIPTGTYPLILTFSQRFQRLLPEIAQVKGFRGIRIHAGNTPQHTAGCILVGEAQHTPPLLNSKNKLNQLVEQLYEALKNNDEVIITIQ